MKLLYKYRNTKIYNMFYTYTKTKYGYSVGVLDDKNFAIQLGIIIDFLYDIGYEVFASKEAYKITTHNPNNKIIPIVNREYPDINVTELYFGITKNRTLNNYYLVIDKLFQLLNEANEPF